MNEAALTLTKTWTTNTCTLLYMTFVEFYTLSVAPTFGWLWCLRKGLLLHLWVRTKKREERSVISSVFFFEKRRWETLHPIRRERPVIRRVIVSQEAQEASPPVLEMKGKKIQFGDPLPFFVSSWREKYFPLPLLPISRVQGGGKLN